ncbi:PREDICTED: uncharacterized protein LOC107067771 [Polistes dominula]|uniref:Uncharacterized protein LOC107067771 n=1 Tax=Polistes dominula TaxID=743375 RepID=A0ABM1IFS0_POLDO|nr:PREDICTED: uncharacterized protein LOC107067771 [Polistes dominula]
MENLSWLLIIFSLYGCLADCIDLGPFIRIGQCRSKCLLQYSLDGTCDFTSDQPKIMCQQCWNYCEVVEKQWEKANQTFCARNDLYENCEVCQLACSFKQLKTIEKYLPSMLPKPKKYPVTLNKLDVAIEIKQINNEWTDTSYLSGAMLGAFPTFPLDSWIIVVTEQGIIQYSWQKWSPTLEDLKEGKLYEATISWKDDESTQLTIPIDTQQLKLNDEIRQMYLEKYGQKVLTELRSQVADSRITDEVFRRFFLKKIDERDDKDKADDVKSLKSVCNRKTQQSSYTVSWEPETGGLTGNQVTDSNSAQISLFPGTKYLVWISSNDGPASLPIEVDTRSIEQVFINIMDKYYYEIACFGSAFILSILLLIVITEIKRRNKKASLEEA